ncbi:hypothetical protein DFH11DRAFT_1632683 [Phellopilus nigrolimitatus]|nr:hypothetical protein DFH11DRAFT_1632683 [Phellopilus nigrolimitatus]
MDGAASASGANDLVCDLQVVSYAVRGRDCVWIYGPVHPTPPNNRSSRKAASAPRVKSCTYPLRRPRRTRAVVEAKYRGSLKRAMLDHRYTHATSASSDSGSRRCLSFRLQHCRPWHVLRSLARRCTVLYCLYRAELRRTIWHAIAGVPSCEKVWYMKCRMLRIARRAGHAYLLPLEASWLSPIAGPQGCRRCPTFFQLQNRRSTINYINPGPRPSRCGDTWSLDIHMPTLSQREGRLLARRRRSRTRSQTARPS